MIGLANQAYISTRPIIGRALLGEYDNFATIWAIQIVHFSLFNNLLFTELVTDILADTIGRLSAKLIIGYTLPGGHRAGTGQAAGRGPRPMPYGPLTQSTYHLP